MCKEEEPLCRRKSDEQLIDIDALWCDLRLQHRKLKDIALKGVDHCKSMDELYDLAVRQDHYRRIRELEKHINGSLSPVVTRS